MKGSVIIKDKILLQLANKINALQIHYQQMIQ